MKPSTQSGGDLAEVFRLHRAELVRLAAFILSDRGAGEDAVQDVFTRVIAWPLTDVSKSTWPSARAGWISHGQLHPLPGTTLQFDTARTGIAW